MERDGPERQGPAQKSLDPDTHYRRCACLRVFLRGDININPADDAMNLKTKLLIAGVVVVLAALIASHIGVYYAGYNAAEHDAQPLPGDPTPQVKPVKGKPCTITIQDVRYYNEVATFLMTATGPGAGEGSIPRPERWKEKVRNNLLMIGLGGGYYAGSWLPSGSLDYLRRVGSFQGVDFYLGPGLSVAALDERPAAEHIAVNIRLSAAALW